MTKPGIRNDDAGHIVTWSIYTQRTDAGKRSGADILRHRGIGEAGRTFPSMTRSQPMEVRIQHPTAPKRRRRRDIRQLLLFSLFCAATAITFAQAAYAQAWSLTKTQRQQYLQYYAPIILQRADENDGKVGRDWITNFDFDRDGDYANNRYNWLQTPQYIQAGGNPLSPYAAWKIRPTLYSALIEYMEGGSKSLVLLYHVYHASDKNGSEIHDWERIELHVRGATGTPGAGGEYVSNTALTTHEEHIVRRYTDYADLNFMQTATGKHLMIWSADESGSFPGERNHQLHYVQNPYSWIAGRFALGTNKAEVDITGDGDKKNVHYA
jgi:hypothetical protein